MNAHVKFKFVTPCIMPGADKLKAEMRAPSVRGHLRWWHRALGWEESWEPEQTREVFGSTDGTAVSSAFIVRDLTENIESQTLDGQGISGEKFDYFLWPLRKDKTGVITENQTVEIKILDKKVKARFTLEEKVLKAFLLLGAMGTRSRRCYGSVYPTYAKINGEEWKIPTNMEEFKNELQNVLDEDANCRVLQLSKPAGNWRKAVKTCADFLKVFRCGEKNPKFGPKALEWGEKDHDALFKDHDEIYRPEIGLPLSTKYYSVDAGRTNDNEKIDRLASPVHFKVVELKEGFVPIAIFFFNHLLSQKTDEVVIIGKNNGKRKTLSVANDLFYEMAYPSDHWDDAECLWNLDN